MQLFELLRGDRRWGFAEKIDSLLSLREGDDVPDGFLTGEDGAQISIHRVQITRDAQKHYHKRLTEYYVVLSGEGEIELDDERVPVKPGDVIMIPPGTAHALRGEFEIINIVIPPFEADDEYGVESEPGE